MKFRHKTEFLINHLFQSWLSGGSTTVNVDAEIDKVVVTRILKTVEERITFYLSNIREYMDEIGRFSLF